jgi:hypothetical protein
MQSPEPSWGTGRPPSNRRLSAPIWLLPTDRRYTTAQSPSWTSQLRARWPACAEFCATSTGRRGTDTGFGNRLARNALGVRLRRRQEG